MGRTTISSKGAVTAQLGSGLGIEKNNSNTGFNPYTPAGTTGSITAPVTLLAGDAGVHAFEGAAEGFVATMPTAASCPGATFVFRVSGAGSTNTLTGSQEVTDTKVFTDGTNNGSRITTPTIVGSSIALVSDGNRFIIMGTSGTFTLAFP